MLHASRVNGGVNLVESDLMSRLSRGVDLEMNNGRRCVQITITLKRMTKTLAEHFAEFPGQFIVMQMHAMMIQNAVPVD